MNRQAPRKTCLRSAVEVVVMFCGDSRWRNWHKDQWRADRAPSIHPKENPPKRAERTAGGGRRERSGCPRSSVARLFSFLRRRQETRRDAPPGCFAWVRAIESARSGPCPTVRSRGGAYRRQAWRPAPAMRVTRTRGLPSSTLGVPHVGTSSKAPISSP